MSEAPEGVLAIVRGEAHGDSRVLAMVRDEAHGDSRVVATWLERRNVTYERLLAILLPLTLLALLSLVCIGGFGD